MGALEKKIKTFIRTFHIKPNYWVIDQAHRTRPKYISLVEEVPNVIASGDPSIAGHVFSVGLYWIRNTIVVLKTTLFIS